MLTRCTCPIWVQGSLGGEWVKRSMKTREWGAAAIVHGWESSGQIGVVKPPKVTRRPTLPFEESEVKRILAAADALASWGSFGPKARAMILLLRYSGLRMQDAACLERSRLKNGRLFL